MFIQDLEPTEELLTLHQLEDEMKQRGFTGTRFLFGDTMKYQLDEFRTLLVTYYNNYNLEECRWFIQRGRIPQRKYVRVDMMIGYSGGSSAVCETPLEAQQAIHMFLHRLHNPTSRDALFIYNEKQRVEKLLADI